MPGLSDKQISKYGDELFESLRSRQPCVPLTEREPFITLEDAYQIQQYGIKRRIALGDRIVGKKIGLTSRVVQKSLGVSEPDFGQLLASMVASDEIQASSLLQPKAEGEVAFLLKRDLIGPGVTSVDVINATDCVMTCFEIVDSRIRDWRIRLQDTVADNASSGMFVLGTCAVSLKGLDLSTCGMVLEKNGAVASTGAGAAALGSPINCVTWLANCLGRFGIPLRAGEIILSGSLGAMLPVAAGDVLNLSIGGIGSASIRFT